MAEPRQADRHVDLRARQHALVVLDLREVAALLGDEQRQCLAERHGIQVHAITSFVTEPRPGADTHTTSPGLIAGVSPGAPRSTTSPSRRVMNDPRYESTSSTPRASSDTRPGREATPFTETVISTSPTFSTTGPSGVQPGPAL